MSRLLAQLHRLRTEQGTGMLMEQLNVLFSDSSDYIAFKIGGSGEDEVFLCYLSTLTSHQQLHFTLSADENSLKSQLLEYEGTPIGEADLEECEQALCSGVAILCMKNSSTGLLLDLQQVQQRGLESPYTETVLQGPLYAFNENLEVNSGLVRQRIRTSQLKSYSMILGKNTRTPARIYYCNDVVDHDCLAKIKGILTNMKADGIQDTGELLRLMDTKRWMRLFPKAILTERPDRVSSDLLRGKIAILLDGTPFALVLPAVYTDFWHSPEDSFVNPYVSVFQNSLRFLAMLMNLFLPALYVALTSINVDVNRLEISLAAAASREGVPYPVFFETVLMLILIDFITEAGTRLPKAISSTVTMVGGVVLGQAIIQANIVSNLLVIIVAATAITNFIVIDYQMGLIQRLLKYFFCVGAGIAGLLGIVYILAAMIFYLSTLDSFGTPYLTTLMPQKGGKK
ncbi:spore germination protein [Paenibacillus pasadenensis]|uniref:spore germination protein n=1 Tax=Paenibacillus pasadenensis TaxID=217090 RepID=UPI00203D5E7C|nr:spore germination protein [Paenibacillus pasadenensis]MCM3749181.1 spore germination protein [Paenibacillus pasadenensis]